MPAIKSRTRYVVCALARMAIAFVITAVIWLVVALIASANDWIKPLDGRAFLIVSLAFLLLAWPSLAKELVADLGPFPKARAPLRLRLRRLRAHRAALRQRLARRFAAKIARAEEATHRARTRATLATSVLARPLDRLEGEDLSRIRNAPQTKLSAFRETYHRALDRLAADGPERISLDPTSLTPTARLLFLPALVGLGDGRRLDRLDLARSDLTAERYVFTGAGRAVELDRWQRALPTIAALLGGRWRVAERDGLSLVLERLPELPASFSLTPDLHIPGELFLGQNLVTGQPYRLPLLELTHTMVVGATGYGKSTLLHQVVVQLARQPERVEHVYLVDLKHGLEFGAYAGRAPHLTIVERYQDLPKLIATVGEILAQRIAVAKLQGLAKYPSKPILVIVDEFAQIMLEPDTKPGREAIIDGFVRLGNQARAANIVLWVQVQHAVAETIPTALRRNLNTVISFRQPNGQAAANIFGDTGDFPVDITRLARGQCLFRHGLTSEITALQAANVGLADIPTLLKGDADAPHP